MGEYRRKGDREREKKEIDCCCCAKAISEQMLLVKQQKCCQQPKSWQHLLSSTTTTTTATRLKHKQNCFLGPDGSVIYLVSNLIKTVAKTQTEPLRALVEHEWKRRRMGNVQFGDWLRYSCAIKIDLYHSRAIPLTLPHLPLLPPSLAGCVVPMNGPWHTHAQYENTRKWASHVICYPLSGIKGRWVCGFSGFDLQRG